MCNFAHSETNGTNVSDIIFIILVLVILLRRRSNADGLIRYGPSLQFAQYALQSITTTLQ